MKLKSLCVIAVLVFSAAVNVQAAFNIYIKTDPALPGEVTTPAAWVDAWQIQVANSASVHPGGVTPGTTSLSDVVVTKLLDKASPKLAKALTSGTPLGDVTLDVIDHVSGLPVYHIILSNAILTSDQLVGEEGGLPVENISIKFQAIEWTYTYQPGGQEFMAYWDSITVTGGPGPFPSPTPTMQQDSDNDGMPDSYEMDNGLNPLTNDANGDKDGDGASNLAEYRAGTRANDAKSVFRVHGISRGNGTVLITWSSVANKTYSITKSATPNGAPTTIQSGILSFEGETSRTVPMTGTKLFYKVTTP